MGMSKGLDIVTLLLCFSLSLARTFSSTTAAILPFSGLLGTKDEEASAAQQQQQYQQNPAGASVPPLPPQRGGNAPGKPPPPPPPPGGQTNKATEEASSQNTAAASSNSNDDRDGNPDYPPHPQFWAPGPFDHYGGLPPPPPGWMGQQQQQQQPAEWQQQQEWDWRRLDDMLARERDLLLDLENLTSILSSYEQREDLHMRQLDVLTERVMDVEAAAAMERNELAEYRHNCTELGRAVALQRDEIEQWTQRCNDLTLQHEQDQERMQEIKAELKKRSREVEEFASAIETARLDAERNKYLAERKKKQKKRGFLYWIFGIGSAEEREEDRLQEAQEHARATLLRALQTERDSVEELENVVSTLQQNNSAIAEMVESRDMLIDELNNRVAVFEEDKLVLKAALRQLQKEMKEEAPKTQKLIDELKEAREEVQRLTAEVNSIISDHQMEVKLLQNVISEKQSAINATESNMTVIGTYVDKLEERLAMFALARRDIEVREQKCKAIEERVVALEQECEELRKETEQYESEHVELKSLLEDLVAERTSLQKEVAELAKEKDGLLTEGQTLRDTIASLEIDVDSLGKAMANWQSRTSELERKVEDQSAELLEKGERENELADILKETLTKMKEMEEEASRAAQAAEVVIAEAKAEGQIREENEASTNGQETPPVMVRPSIPPPPPPAGCEQALDESQYAIEEQAGFEDETLAPFEAPSDEKEQSDASVKVEDLACEADLLETDDMRLEHPFEGDDVPGSSIDGTAPPSVGGCDTVDREDSTSQTMGEAITNPENAFDGSAKLDTFDDATSSPEPLKTQLADEVDSASDDLPDDVEDSGGSTDSESDEEHVVPDVDDTKDEVVADKNKEQPSPPARPQDPAQISPSSIKGSPPPGTMKLPPRPNKIPFRAIRKAFSRTTGIHGLITRPSRFYPTRQQKRQARLMAKQREKREKLQLVKPVHNPASPTSPEQKHKN